MLTPVRAWFAQRGWEPFAFQEEVWARYLAGQSGLLHASMGHGKTLAAWMGPLAESLEDPRAHESPGKRAGAMPLTTLWLTPMRALAQDLTHNLEVVTREIAPGWLVEARTGDTSSSARGRQRRRLPTGLVTTPESLTVLLSHPESAGMFASLRAVIVDEWHELLGTKRGTQTELALARLRTLSCDARFWGLSATLGNTPEALDTLLGCDHTGALVSGPTDREIIFETLASGDVGRFPWAGHMGLHLAEQVVARLDEAKTSLVFVNTRGQAERWYQALRYFRPDRSEQIALHHGSLEREERTRVERGVASGELWATVATSSLDLGVDFAPVEQVLQIGSPKGVARLAQRAGRSGHDPGRTSRLIGVPTHALELIEFEAARRALARGRIEERRPIIAPLDVLAQHVVTCAMGGGFVEAELLKEVRSTAAYRDLTDQAWTWVMDFCRFGGKALSAYDRYARIKLDGDRWVVGSRRIATDHRSAIGTITGYGTLPVILKNGQRLGSVEELFLARLSPGEAFTFAGRSLELVRIEADKAVVRVARARTGAVARWMGGRMPLSTELASTIREILEELRSGARIPDERLAPVHDLIATQTEASRVPALDELLIERIRTREGDHVFMYPVAGRLVHEGLATLIAHRISRRAPATLASTCSDWGLAIAASDDLGVHDEAWQELLSADDLLEDVIASVDASGLARRHFREVARIAGLITTGPVHQRISQRQLQSSSGLIFDVLEQFDPDNLLLSQARREVLERSLELTRLRATLEAIGRQQIIVTRPEGLSPLSFHLWADRIREQVSSQTWEQRVAAMIERLEKHAGQARHHTP